ncbi:zinc-ribbon domain-containing protein [Anaerotruncus sp. AF02-27]|nr:zinc-ribbon domain-containing protein [Anaerotruncus sp. AF02-27]
MANRFCTSCGAQLEDDKKFCTSCGAPAEGKPEQEPAMAAAAVSGAQTHSPDPMPAQPPYQLYQQPQPVYQQTPPPPPAPIPVSAADSDLPPPAGSKYAPIGLGGWIGIMLLMLIPIVNIILLIVWACGGCKKVTKRSFARASLILMAVGIVLSLAIGLMARSFINKAIDVAAQESGFSAVSGLSGLLGGRDADESKKSGAGDLSALSGLGGNGSNSSDDSGASDLDELSSLLGILGGLEALSGGEGGSGLDLEALNALAGAADAAEGASGNGIGDGTSGGGAVTKGWPAGLRPYPFGNVSQPMDYRTEISGTSREEMVSYIGSLKSDGFVFQDFLEFGFTEEEMLSSMDGWWATDGKLYISISYYDGVVTVDYLTEKPTMESLMEMMGG